MHGFVSYSHEDHRLYAGFRPHLAAIGRAFDLDIWTDHKIETGTVWSSRIAAAIRAAQVFVLMITPEFIGSDYVSETEIPAIRERRRAGALVLPVVVKRCSWQYVATALQATPIENGKVKPVADWRPGTTGRPAADFAAGVRRRRRENLGFLRVSRWFSQPPGEFLLLIPCRFSKAAQPQVAVGSAQQTRDNA